jgi:hypothetical protein
VIEIYGPGQVGATFLNATAGATITGLNGVMSYFPNMYEILPDPNTGTVSGNVTYTAVPLPSGNEFTIASTNLEHFYNTTQDPNRPPDASSTNVDPTAFAGRVSKLSLGIRHVLNLPDVMGVEEMLNLSTLQTVAAQINSDAQAETGVNPGYTAYLAEGNDISNINVGFLVKKTVTVVDVTQYGKDDTITNPTTGSVSPLNDRPPLVLRAQIAQPGSNNSTTFTVIQSPAVARRYRRSELRPVCPSEAEIAGGISDESDSGAPGRRPQREDRRHRRLQRLSVQ